MSVYQLKISLLAQSQPVYRTIQFDEEDTFWDLAQDIQTAFALSGFESWVFYINENLMLADLDLDASFKNDEENLKLEDAADVELNEYLQTNQNGIIFSYIFDTEEEGSSTDLAFDFSIELESIFPTNEEVDYPICVDAKGDHPDEDFLDLSKLTKKELMMHKASHLLDIDEINKWFHEGEFSDIDDDFEDDFGFLDNPEEAKKDRDGGFSIPFSLN